MSARTANVMVVDDDPDVLALLSNVLSSAGHHVTVHSQSDAALQALSTGSTDLLIADIGLPGKTDGIRLGEEATKLHPKLKVLFITGAFTKESLANKALANDAPVLHKPFSLQSFVEHVNHLIHSLA